MLSVRSSEHVISTVRSNVDVLRSHQSSHLGVFVQLLEPLSISRSVVAEVDHVVGSPAAVLLTSLVVLIHVFQSLSISLLLGVHILPSHHVSVELLDSDW